MTYILKVICFGLFRKIKLSYLAIIFSFSTYAQVAKETISLLQIPQPEIDDPMTYEGYKTRFYRDIDENIVQIYIDSKSERIVHLWADAVSESIGFTKG